MSVYPAWATGDVLSAAFLRDSRPQIVQTTTIQTCDSTNISGVTDNELFFYADASAGYLVSTHLLFNQITTDVPLLVSFSMPNGTTFQNQSFGSTDTPVDFTSRTDTNLFFRQASFSGVHLLKADGVDAAVWTNAVFLTASAPGFISLIWGPQTTVTGTITRDAGSVMRVIRFS